MPLANKKGLLRMVIVRARAADVAAASIPTSLETIAFGTEITRYWKDISRGAVDIAVHVHPPEIVLSQPAAVLGTVRRNVIADAIIQAAGAGVDLGQADLWAGFVNTPCDSGATGNRVIVGSFQELGQREWAWCGKCGSLAFWDRTGNPGRCAAGGTHDHSGSSSYIARIEGQSAGERGWRWCRKCACLAHPNGSPGPCPAGAGHDHSASASYVVATSATQATQDQWRRCTRCTALVFDGNAGAPCPAGGTHQLAGDFFVGFDQFPSLGFMLHETGHTLGLDHSFNDSPDPLDANDDSRPGAYGDPGDIMSYARTSSFRSEKFVNAGPGLAASTIYKNGWIGPDRMSFVNQPGEVELVSNSEPIDSGFLAAVVGVPGSAKVYSLEYRTPVNWDQAVDAGVMIREHRAVADTPSLGLLAQNGWRWCSRCSSLTYRGHRACAAGSEHASDGSAAGVFFGNVPQGAQAGWQWCSRCQSLVQEQSGPGVCAAGGRHDTSRSGQYAVAIAGPNDPKTPLWLWCVKCRALYLSDPDGGRCPTGGQHDGTRSLHYRLGPVGPTSQSEWTSCSRCRSVFYDGLGACPAGQRHDTSASGDYFLVPNVSWAPGQSGWRWCNKCFGMAFTDPSRQPGLCAGGGRHDHAGSSMYKVEPFKPHAPAIPQAFVDDTEQTGWAWCHRCEMLGYKLKPSHCPAGGAHDFSQSTSYVLRFAVSGKGDEGHLQQSRSWKLGERFTTTDGLLTVDVVAARAQPARVTLRIDVTPLGAGKNLIQSTFGKQGNFELLVPQNDAVTHFIRNNDDPQLAWHRVAQLEYKAPPNQLGPHPAGVTFIQSNFKGDGAHGNFEAVVRVRPAFVLDPAPMDHWFFDSKADKWAGPFPFIADGQRVTGVTGDPILIQSNWGTRGNFELLVPQGDAIAHYSRDNDNPQLPWRRVGQLPYKVPTGQLGPVPQSVTFVQSTFKGDGVHGNFEAVVRVHPAIASNPETLDSWFFDSATLKWTGPFPLAADGQPVTQVTGDPLLIQSTSGRKGNFELLVPQGDAIVQYSRDNDNPQFPWRRTAQLAYKAPPGQLGPRPAGIAMIQSNFKGDGVRGNYEAAVRVHPAIASDPDSLDFWFFNSKSQQWNGPFPLVADGQHITGVTGF
jgi:hypothetical protein